ncbi:alpha/beta fold hydrolase [Actinocrispum wychmicini]|uniref:Pimeloyl-ACP methyl ester carboxylesterase n=1 Tax=Actinocrispum wychmicini TaxID=1213861 RepID=A0A4R2J1E6_9PSEU|nr:alpha/beta fold hydrolase [Actinocrispum wychmicini]TCO50636.1 pimeloyl-ACP methyl ester carboxylesterase [Actinocrispum wychmicini]
MHIAYDDKGTGQALVLVHGHPFDRTMWRPQLDRFSQTHRVIVPDLRGYGESPVVPGTFDMFARDIKDLLDRLGVDEVVMGGLSMGGQIAMEFHRLFPTRLRAWLLADTFPGVDTPDGRQFRYDTADRLEQEGMAGYADEVIWKMVSPRNEHAAAHVLRMMRDAPPLGAAAALRARAERPDYVHMLTQVRIPTLIVAGSEDSYTPVSVAEEMHGLIAGSELAVIEGAAHLPNLERQTEFDHRFQRFLDTVG